MPESAINSDTFQVSTPSDHEIVMTRLFNAPRQLVFEAMSKPEHVKRWWGNLGEGYSVPVCEIDFRVGGKWRFVNTHPKGEFGVRQTGFGCRGEMDWRRARRLSSSWLVGPPLVDGRRRYRRPLDAAGRSNGRRASYGLGSWAVRLWQLCNTSSDAVWVRWRRNCCIQDNRDGNVAAKVCGEGSVGHCRKCPAGQ